MRKLVILRGSMGCGKSTWLKENDLEKFTLCADTMRLHLAAPAMGIQGHDIISQKDNRQAWEMLFFFLEERMKRGEFTIIDAVHSKSSEFSRYKQLADQYRYRLYCVDFTDIPIEVAKERNVQRPEYKRVPESEIDKVYSRFATQGKTSGFTVVKPEEFFDKVLSPKPFDWNEYKNIHIFGDIHGCSIPLKEYFMDNPYTEDDGYIFVGDYFDRGLQNAEVFHFIKHMIEKPNTLFLTGNHEIHLRDYAYGMPVKSKEFMNKTAVQLTETGATQQDLRQICRKLGQIAYITFRGYDFIVSHGGVPYIPNNPIDFYSTDSFIRGAGNYSDDIDKIFDDWAQQTNETRRNSGENEIYQIHGHRNILDYSLINKEYSYNLEGKIEFGGNLRVLRIEDDGSFHPVEIKNNVFDEELLKERELSKDGSVQSKFSTVGMYIQELRNSKFIQEKVMQDTNISSFNFTRNAFDKGIWGGLTTKARGLFIDTKNEKIQARSYDKFFNKNEREETRINFLMQNLAYPVRYFKKYNGFLGILSMKDNELYFCSKSTDQGDYVEYFKSIFYMIYNEEQIEAIKDRFRKEDISMVFEVIDPINDPHMIKSTERTLVLLDMIYNKIDFEKVKYEHLVSFGLRNNIKVKELAYVVDTPQEFLALNNEISAEDYQYDGEYIEGFVVEDSNGFMFKYKLYYYSVWKMLRGITYSYLKNPTGTSGYTQKLTTPMQNYYLAFLKEKYPNGATEEERATINIITLRDEFVKTEHGSDI